MRPPIHASPTIILSRLGIYAPVAGPDGSLRQLAWMNLLCVITLIRYFAGRRARGAVPAVA